jgi:type I restriction-modification system DNA methylase subunit
LWQTIAVMSILANVQTFLDSCQNVISTGQATEHSYRKSLETLLNSLSPEITALNEPKRQKVGAPDFIIFQKDLPIAYLEAKDMVVSLDQQLRTSDQITRYQALGNLCFTNNLDWIFYQNTTENTRISIGKLEGNQIIPQPENFELLGNLLLDFVTKQSITIRSPLQLAAKMAEKSRLLKAIVFNTLESDEVSNDLQSQYQAFKEDLINDLTHDEFADIYAQTIAYGLFTARFYDPSLPTFSRDEARSLLPKSNPFLRKFFDHVAGIDMEARIVWVIDDLIQLFRHVDVTGILKDFGNRTKQTDPILHFYETFLGEYDPAKRKARGVYYTPQPVVDFIVRSVDEILKQDFGLARGLADSSKVTQQISEASKYDHRDVRVETAGNNTKKYYIDTHKVQILDPATGTGTFPLAVIKHIEKSFENMKGMWPQYVAQDLIPRLHGFEIMMSSYSMAHLKLAMYLRESGVTLTDNQRLDIYLTNSLEEGKEDTHNLFSAWLSNEAKEANYIKNQTPVMVVIGNPPYSVSSSNSGQWIKNLIQDYKKDLNEKKINLDDDYIKFIRYAQNYIDKNGSGVVAYISNNSFLDGITHRQMRKSLLETFDDIYILDLHGNAKKKEVSPDGTPDNNVFDIMQGVSINIFVKTGNKKIPKSQNASQNTERQDSPLEGWQSETDGVDSTLATVHHADLYGKRQSKYDYLDTNSLSTVNWQELNYTAPNYFFVPKDFSLQSEYEKGIKLDELFNAGNSGVKTDRDSLFIDKDKNQLANRIQTLLSGNYNNEFASKYRVEDSGSYKLTTVIQNKIYDSKYLTKIQYRPFDYRWVYYDPKVISRPGYKVMQHLINRDNFSLITSRQFGGGQHFICFVTKVINEISSQPFAPYYNFPLYLYTENK